MARLYRTNNGCTYPSCLVRMRRASFNVDTDSLAKERMKEGGGGDTLLAGIPQISDARLKGFTKVTFALHLSAKLLLLDSACTLTGLRRFPTTYSALSLPIPMPHDIGWNTKGGL